MPQKLLIDMSKEVLYTMGFRGLPGEVLGSKNLDLTLRGCCRLEPSLSDCNAWKVKLV